MRPVPKKGQTLYSLNVGNAARHSEQKLTECTVVSVGPKYFQCQFESWRHPIKFHVDTWHEKTEYSSNYCLYASPQEWEDEKREQGICNFIHRAFEYGKNVHHLRLDDLVIIEAILTAQVIKNVPK